MHERRTRRHAAGTFHAATRQLDKAACRGPSGDFGSRTPGVSHVYTLMLEVVAGTQDGASSHLASILGAASYTALVFVIPFVALPLAVYPLLTATRRNRRVAIVGGAIAGIVPTLVCLAAGWLEGLAFLRIAWLVTGLVTGITMAFIRSRSASRPQLRAA